jgi:hypothetical protein
MTHELSQHIDYLRGALQQDRRPLGLLLGAGAPMAIKNESGGPLIPDIAGLTAFIKECLQGDAAEVTRRAFSQLEANATVENLLNYLRTLASLPGSGDRRGFSRDQVANADEAVCAAIRSKLDVSLPSEASAYHSLGLWSRAARRHAPIEIFTTNYDLLIEQALDETDVPYFDGFVGSRNPRFDLQAVEEDILPGRWVRLWKIHGSVNWRLAVSGEVSRTSAADGSPGTLIYPSDLKYAQSRRLPYLALMDRLRYFLKQPSAVLVSCGFAYRDEHINEVIIQALRSNPTGAVIALLYGPLDGYPEAVTLAAGSPNLSLYARDQAVIGLRRGPWEQGLGAAVSECDLGDFGHLARLLRETAGVTTDDSTPAVIAEFK